MSKWKVYISSTFRDLKDFRAELINLFQNQLKNNFELSAIMERMFDDGSYTPFVDDCADAVLSSDIYIIILGNKTGSFPPGEDKTYTEIELDTALANDKRIFCLRLENFDENEIDNKAKHNELLNKFKGRPIHTFKDLMELKNVLYECLIPFSSQSPINKMNPYKGLAAFNVEDGDYFFGRNIELESCLKKIITKHENTFISVIGSSGTGKSSFARAGMLYRLKNREELGFSDYLQIIVTPGNEPFTNLKYQLQLIGISSEDLISTNFRVINLILLFDQFEEVITQCNTPKALEERKHLFEFLDALTSTENPNLRILVITTFRSDFLSQLVNYDFIKNQDILFPLSSLDYKIHVPNWQQSIEEIITRPALKNGVVVEKELVNQISNQIKEVEGSLSILQFALQRLWDEHTITDRLISTKEYSQLSEGKGIAGIIETHAEQVIKRITNNGKDKEREAVLKSIFVNLVEVTENLQDVKKTITKDELLNKLMGYPSKIANEIFEDLVSEKSRLLTVTKDKDKSINVNIIHEVLIRKWNRLKTWIDERREALQYKKRLTIDIAAFNKGEENLYGRKKLKRANLWKIQNPDLTNEEINAFLLKAEKIKKTKIYRLTGAALLVFFLVYLINLVVSPIIQKKNFLNVIEIYETLNNELIEAGGIIDSVKTLTIDETNFKFLVKNLKFYKNLEYLSLKELSLIEDLTFLKNIKNSVTLKSLFIGKNTNLTSIDGIENLTNLKRLNIQDTDSLKSLKGIENLLALTNIFIYGAKSMSNLAGIENLDSLKSLSINGVENLNSLAGIKNHTILKDLSIGGTKNLSSIVGIENLPNLQSLSITGNSSIKSLIGIENLPNLQSLSIEGNSSIKSLMGIQNLPNLQSLNIKANYVLESLAGIENLPSLQSLDIDMNRSLKNLIGIENLNNLNYLSITHNRSLKSIKGIENLSNLDTLVIGGNDSLESLTGIENLEDLTYLFVFNRNMTSLKRIASLNNLQSLSIGNDSIKSLAGIENLTKLQKLHIIDCNGLENLTGIEKNESLRDLTITGTMPNLNHEALYKLSKLDGLPKLERLSISRQLGIELGIDLNRLRKKNPGVEVEVIDF